MHGPPSAAHTHVCLSRAAAGDPGSWQGGRPRHTLVCTGLPVEGDVRSRSEDVALNLTLWLFILSHERSF